MTAVISDIDLRKIATDFTNEVEQLNTELHEIEVLIRQTNGEIERLQQRQLEVSAYLRQIENNFDSYAREDIRKAYGAERDAQLRLAMMRSQLEQFQNKQRFLDTYIQKLRRVSDLTLQMAEQASAAKGTVSSPTNPNFDHDAVVQTIEAQEAERQRLAQQMHDGPAQSMTNLILQAEIVERLFEHNPERARAELANLKTSANVTFQRVREFIFGLRPMMLDDLGLVPTLKRYAQTFEMKNKLPVTLTINGDRTLPLYIEVTIFRAMQELLTNVVRHANAAHAQANVDLSAEPVVVSVEDDGSGFNANDILTRVRASGTSGLSTLEKRVEMLGGKITYQSGTGRGTRVRVQIPPA